MPLRGRTTSLVCFIRFTNQGAAFSEFEMFLWEAIVGQRVNAHSDDSRGRVDSRSLALVTTKPLFDTKPCSASAEQALCYFRS